MSFSLFHRKPPLDETSIGWIFDVFGWALRNLDGCVFFRDTILVTPTNEHFPGRANSAHELARLMFERSRAYAGMTGWPMQLLQPGALGAHAISLSPPATTDQCGREPPPGTGMIALSYDPAMINNPEAMIAGFAQVLAHHLGSKVSEPPPGGKQNWPHITELLGVYLGFGLLLANTAFNLPRRSCGSSCGTAPTERQSFLSQEDITYALALFCELKGIANNAVLPQLKSTLRGSFKRGRKDVASRTGALAQLRQQPLEPATPLDAAQAG